MPENTNDSVDQEDWNCSWHEGQTGLSWSEEYPTERTCDTVSIVLTNAHATQNFTELEKKLISAGCRNHTDTQLHLVTTVV